MREQLFTIIGALTLAACTAHPCPEPVDTDEAGETGAYGDDEAADDGVTAPPDLGGACELGEAGCPCLHTGACNAPLVCDYQNNVCA